MIRMVEQNLIIMSVSSIVLTFLACPLLSANSIPAENQTAASGNQVIISPGSSSPSNVKFFDPLILNVPVGATVTWKNLDSTLHTVTSGSAESGKSGTYFDSSYLTGGKTFQHTFNSAGTFDYFCTLHPYMKGQVVVN